MVKLPVFIILLIFLAVNSTAQEWMPVKEIDLRVQENSALDFSLVFPSHHRALTIQGSHFSSFGSTEKQRMHCAVVAFTRLKGGFPTKEESEQFADELQRRGYNLLRLHMLDMALMVGAKKDFDFNLSEMDKMFYLVSVLKKHGIYLEIDAETSWNGGYSDVKFPFEKNKHAMQLEIYFGVTAMNHWKQLVRAMMLKKNPYTGVSLLHDPNTVMVTLMNEMGLYNQLNRLYIKKKASGKMLTRLQKGVNALFQEWMKNKYTSIQSLNNAWRPLFPLKDFSSLEIEWKTSNRVKQSDISSFIYETESLVQTEMIQYLRDEGYAGFLTNLNASREIMSGSVRQSLDVVTLHNYHDHPKKSGRLGHGAAPMRKQQNTSSLDNNLQYVRVLAANRLSGKPFVVDEYNHPFPNPWRREAGLVFPAYASFQDWDGICRFAEPVQLSYQEKGQANIAISAFNVGMDPIARAGETLSALLFRRGDVQVAAEQAVMHLNPEIVVNKGAGQWPNALSSLALDFQLESDWKKEGAQTISFSEQGRLKATVALNKVLAKPKKALKEVFGKDDLRKSVDSRDVKKDIRLSSEKRQFIVESRRTLAVTFAGKDSQISLRGMNVSNIHDAGLVSVSSLDDQSVSQSKRILLTFQTDARNTGMVFSQGEKMLKEHGSFPVLILRGQLSIVLKHQTPMKLYALNLRGERVKELEVEHKQGKLTFDLDNKIKGWGPVVFYELVEGEKVKG